jgi:hypothetical protein
VVMYRSGPWLCPQIVSCVSSWVALALFGCVLSLCPQPVSSACVTRGSGPHLGCVLSFCLSCLSGSHRLLFGLFRLREFQGSRPESWIEINSRFQAKLDPELLEIDPTRV